MKDTTANFKINNEVLKKYTGKAENLILQKLKFYSILNGIHSVFLDVC